MGGGDTVWALKAMTGDPARSFKNLNESLGWKRQDLVNKGNDSDMRKAVYELKDETINNDAMFDILSKYNRLGSVLSASGASGESGLHKGHAYSILSLKKVK